MLLSPILAYHSVCLVVFGVVGLMFFPLQMLRMTGFKAHMEEKQLMIYRICGLWVAAGGIVSLLAWMSEHRRTQWNACAFFAVVHGIELLIKMRGVPGSVSHLLANGHLVLLLVIACF